MPWTAINPDGQPASDLSGNVTLYEIFDGSSTGLTVRALGRWLVPAELTVTHWKLPTFSAAP